MNRKNVFPFTLLPVCQTDWRSAVQKNIVFTNSNLIIYISSHVCKWLRTKQLPWKPYQVQACLKYSWLTYLYNHFCAQRPSDNQNKKSSWFWELQEIWVWISWSSSLWCFDCSKYIAKEVAKMACVGFGWWFFIKKLREAKYSVI